MRFMIKPTHKCNLSCPYCYEHLHDYNGGPEKMDMAIIDQLASVIKSSSLENVIISFIGGEVSLMGEEWLRKAITTLGENAPNSRIGIQTNLVDFDISAFSDLLKDRVLGISTSHDGLQHDFFRCGTSETVIEKFAELEELVEYAPGFLTTASAEFMADYLENTKFLLKSFKTNCLNYRFMTDCNGVEKGDYSEYISNWKALIDLWLSGEIHFRERTILMLISLLSKWKTFDNTCSYNRACYGTVLAVQPDGTLTPCDNMAEVSLGTVYDYTNIKDAFEQPNGLKIKSDLEYKFTHGECAKCYFKAHCGGGCYSRDSYLVTGDAKGVNKFFCDFKKDLCNHLYEKIMAMDNATINLEEVYRECRFANLDLFKVFLKESYGGTYANKL